MLKPMFIFFGRFGIRYFAGWLAPVKEELLKSNLNILFEVYVGKMITIAVLAFLLTFNFITFAFTISNIEFTLTIISAIILAGVVSASILTIYHSYPFHLLTSKKNSIEANQPFALNHMAAIAASGVPPFVVFKLLSAVPEYGEISNESKRIVRNVDTFGMDMITAIRNVADRTPSVEFKQFLYGIIATIDTGGDLKTYLQNSAKDALFGYRLRREKYLQTLSTYADFYTAVLIAAPLFFVSVLSIMSLIGGQIFGLNIPDAMRLGIFAMIPLLNTVFIAFIHYTQPSL
ncbi:MAG: type II secretion system F family protein [Candidatus Aenigmarchaeota archaeon]|nr:type II secretion system F family protein [Candidatus Aenigmarchaeota archaeon]